MPGNTTTTTGTVTASVWPEWSLWVIRNQHETEDARPCRPDVLDRWRQTQPAPPPLDDADGHRTVWSPAARMRAYKHGLPCLVPGILYEPDRQPFERVRLPDGTIKRRNNGKPVTTLSAGARLSGLVFLDVDAPKPFPPHLADEIPHLAAYSFSASGGLHAYIYAPHLRGLPANGTDYRTVWAAAAALAEAVAPSIRVDPARSNPGGYAYQNNTPLHIVDTPAPLPPVESPTRSTPATRPIARIDGHLAAHPEAWSVIGALAGYDIAAGVNECPLPHPHTTDTNLSLGGNKPGLFIHYSSTEGTTTGNAVRLLHYLRTLDQTPPTGERYKRLAAEIEDALGISATEHQHADTEPVAAHCEHPVDRERVYGYAAAECLECGHLTDLRTGQTRNLNGQRSVYVRHLQRRYPKPPEQPNLTTAAYAAELERAAADTIIYRVDGYDIPIHRKTVLFGEPGTGKSTIARRLADEHLTGGGTVRIVHAEDPRTWISEIDQQRRRPVYWSDTPDDTDGLLLIVDDLSRWCYQHGYSEDTSTGAVAAFIALRERWPNAYRILIHHPAKPSDPRQRLTPRGSGRWIAEPRLIYQTTARRRLHTYKTNLGAAPRPLIYDITDTGRLHVVGYEPDRTERQAATAERLAAIVGEHPELNGMTRKQIEAYIDTAGIDIPNTTNGKPYRTTTAARKLHEHLETDTSR